MPRPRKQVITASSSAPRKQTILEERIRAIVAASMDQLVAAVRADIVAQLQQTIGAQNSTTSAPRAMSNGSALKPAKAGRPRLLDAGAIERVYDVVKASPGLRSEQLMKLLPLTPKLVKLALAKLREAKRIKMAGVKRGATYEAR
jgi:hypothetical protein